MKGRIFMTLFALPFFSVGVWMLWLVSNTFITAYEMQDWVQVEARLGRSGYDTKRGDDSYTYEAYAEYSYTFKGQSYTANRVSVHRGADNIGDYQQIIGRNLSNAQARGEVIFVYVDPENPGDAVIDRGIRWALIGFKSIFLFVFGGVGLGLIILAWRAPKEKDKSDPRYASSPWLVNDDWQSESIRSSSKASMYGVWAFAAFWNLISAPLPFIMYDEVLNKKNTIALVGLLFTVIGIWLIAWAIRRTLEWKRFGATPVILDPFPGSIGGHVGGTIEIGLPFDTAHDFGVSLTNVYSYVSGSGKNRSRKESAKWQDSIVAHAEPGGTGTKLMFRFDVPEGLSESDADQDGSYTIWRLGLSANLDGTNLDRSYDIPVYATAEHSRQLSGLAMERAREKQQSVSDQEILNVVQLRNDANGRRMFYPIGRSMGSSLGAFIIGATFAAVGWWLVVEEGRTVFGSVFGGIGALVGVFALYMVLNSLEVARDAQGIRTVRRVLGIPVKRSYLNRAAFVKFKKKSSHKTQQGKKHIVYYTVYAVDTDGDKVVVGEGFKGESQADAAIRLVSRELGLQSTERPGKRSKAPTGSWDPAGLLTRSQ